MRRARGQLFDPEWLFDDLKIRLPATKNIEGIDAS